MDGTKAAAAMRVRERGGSRTPIIALTASHAKGERERAMAAGMDDFLTKPVDIGALCAVVQRWTRPQAETDASTARAMLDRTGSGLSRMPSNAPAAKDPALGIELISMAPDADMTPEQRGQTELEPETSGRVATEPLSDGFGSTSTEPSPIVDMARLEDACMGLPALRDALLQTFMSDVHPRLVRLAEAISAQDARRVEFEAHGLKGMSATVGAIACAEVFAKVERLAGEEQLAEMSNLLDKARAEVQRTEQHIERLESILKRNV
jgi:HPt (histidine-containing phosphotransfer) domain-containing protein